jgi:hypothetical protein
MRSLPTPTPYLTQYIVRSLFVIYDTLRGLLHLSLISAHKPGEGGNQLQILELSKIENYFAEMQFNSQEHMLMHTEK